MTLIAAVSDVHAPIYLSKFSSSISLRLSSANLMLFAGDMIYKGNIGTLSSVLNIIRKVYKGTIVSTFGNEEFDELHERLKQKYEEVVWLMDDAFYTTLGNKKVMIVGTRGSLQKPTNWQRERIKNIEQIYADRVKKIRELLMNKSGVDLVLLLSHYATCRETVFGEEESAYPYLMDPRMEEVISLTQPDIVIHGHAHNAIKLSCKVGKTLVYNVAFPARKAITMIEV
ncbi:MAG: metallophosphoesterase [Thermoproteota archaeon]|nr:metallophosphoesterase [Candidatus Brockarchaeota archaeon]MBO3801586.1 metallophosphoesterase [Candidatus Brockarchaeota archaeon]